MARDWTDDEGRTWTVRPDEGELVFQHGGRRYVATSDRAGDMESLDDDELRRIFEAARSEASEKAAAGGSPRSPSAAGRESAPHVDPAEHGSTDTD